jgi:hypothetical protein
VTVRSGSFRATPGSGAGFTVRCRGRERATGGGFDATSGSVSAQESRPEPRSGRPTAWHVAATPTAATADLTVYVVCSSP